MGNPPGFGPPEDAPSGFGPPEADSPPPPDNSIIGGAAQRIEDLGRGLAHQFRPPETTGEKVAEYAFPGGAPALRMAKGYVQGAGQGLQQAAQYAQQPGLPNKLRAGVTALGAINPLTTGSTTNINTLEDQGRNREAIGQAAVDLVPLAAGALRGPVRALASDPEGSMLRGVAPPAAKGIRTLKSYEAVKPLLKGAQNLEDLQRRTVEAQARAWKPYSDALSRIGVKQVLLPTKGTTQGGVLTTVSELEKMRREVSAQLDTVRSANPIKQQLAIQQGLNAADLTEKYNRILSVLDPELRKAGIDPVGIRKLHGQINDIRRPIEGKTTVGQPNKPYGIGKIAEHPFRPSSYPKALEDLGAGRPTFYGKPTDVDIQEAFRTAKIPKRVRPKLAPPAIPANTLPPIAPLPVQRPTFFGTDDWE
jgi:hypothetical protein